MSAPQEAQLLSVQLSEAYNRGKEDINFAALCMPEIFIYALPIFMWQLGSSYAPKMKTAQTSSFALLLASSWPRQDNLRKDHNLLDDSL